MENVLQNIKENNDDDNRRAIYAVATTLGTDDRLEFLGQLCEMIYKEKASSEKIQCLLEPFDEDEDLDKVVIAICREFVSTKEEIRYIVKTSKNLSDIIYMLTLLFSEKKNMSYQITAENLLFSYDYTLDNNDIDSLLENLEEYEQDSREDQVDDISCYLKNKKIYDREDYENPYWVTLNQGENIGLLATTPTGISETSDEEVKFNKIIDSSSSFFHQLIPRNQKMDEDISSFSITDLPENIKKSIQVFLKASTDSEMEESGVVIGTPDRVWGPVNRMIDRDCCSGPEGEGPCRMLQCECLELDEDDNNEVYENKGEVTWFSGKCDSCRNFIPDLSHAIRFPNRDGGWKGCYCSFDCMEKDPPHMVSKEETILLGIMKNNIDRHGIMDRSSFC